MPTTKPNLLNEPIGSLSDLINHFYKTGLIYRLSLEQLGRSFLEEYFELGTGENFNKIRSLYIENTEENEQDVPEDESLFFLKIAELFFNYDREPGKLLVEHFQMASAHLKYVDNQVIEIEKEINRIRDEKNTTSIQTEIPVLSYYLNHNRQAREQIVEFLKDDIYTYTLQKSDPLARNSFAFSVPYNYAWNPDRYQVTYPTLISNKFGELSLGSYNEVKQKFTNDKTGFQQFLESYISHYDVVNAIRRECKENHFLATREGTIEEALSGYEDKKKILFSSIGMTIIEGIFHDICIALGKSENDVLTMGFQEKINIMEKELDYNFNHEYYSFKFRLLRNKVAHGLMDAVEAAEITDLILLDIRDAIKISHSIQIPANQKRFFLHQALKEGKTGDFRYLIAYLFMKKTEIPSFYNSAEDDEEAIKLVQSKEFFDFIDLCRTQGPVEQGLAYAVIKAVKDNPKYNDPKVNEQCIERLRGTFKDLPKFELKKFIAPLIGYVSGI